MVGGMSILLKQEFKMTPGYRYYARGDRFGGDLYSSVEGSLEK
jgi:hypothetical protein